MRIIKIYLIGCMLILSFSVLLIGTTFISNVQDKKGISNVFSILATRDSFECKWNRTWGGNNTDWSRETVVDSSHNVYLAGFTWSFGAGYADMCLVKYDGNGMQQWNRTWGGTSFDYGNGVAVDLSDNVYLAGYTSSFGEGYNDMILVKYDGNGEQQWNRTWGDANPNFCNAVVVDSSGNVYITGHTEGDIILVKYDGNGMQQWNCTWDDGDEDYGRGMAVDLSGNIYIAGENGYLGVGGEMFDMILVKYDGNGVQQWNRTWGGADYDTSDGVAVDSSGNVYLAGRTESFGVGVNDMALVKYNGEGIQQWNRTWGDANPNFCNAVAVDSSGNAYLVGGSGNYGLGNGNMALVKYDGNGVLQWNYTWGGDNNDCGYGIAVDSSDSVYLAGGTESFGAGVEDMFLVKYSSYIAPASIPSYNLFVIIGIIGISTLLSVKKKGQQRSN